MKCGYCGHELCDPELCPEGEQLWCRASRSKEFLPAYYDYCKHIVECKECQKRLELSDAVIDVLRQIYETVSYAMENFLDVE